MKLVPLNDRVIVKPIEAPTMTKGGLHLPESSKEVPVSGKVLAVGCGRYDSGGRIELGVSPGETVWYGRYAGTKIKLDDKEYLVLSENEILAVER